MYAFEKSTDLRMLIFYQYMPPAICMINKRKESERNRVPHQIESDRAPYFLSKTGSMALFFMAVEKIRKFSVAFYAEALLGVEF